jgi:hypothetical protein
MGMVSLRGEGISKVMPRRKTQSKFPMIPAKSEPLLRSPLKQRENPQIHQITVVHPMETKLWIMMARTFFRPTRPP